MLWLKVSRSGGCVRSDRNFWLSNARFVRLQPLLPGKIHGGPRANDTRMVSDSIHILRCGLCGALPQLGNL